MALYPGYFDDSGHESRQYLVCGGLVIDVEHPEEFDRQWLGAIAPLDHLHTKDFVGGFNEYAAWKERGKEKHEILCRAADLIGQRSFQTFSVVLNMDDYERLNTECAFSEAMARPFAFCARVAATQLQHWNHQSERIKMVFERRQEGEGDVLDVFARDTLPRPSFEEKKLSPLQAADLVAWAYDSRYSRPDSYRRVGRDIIAALPAILHSHDLISYRELLGTATRMATVAGFEIPTRPLPLDKPVAFHSAPNRNRMKYKRP